jgi:hypothetical protein
MILELLFLRSGPLARWQAGVYDTTHGYMTGAIFRNGYEPTEGLCPNLLATCQQLHAEGVRILYSDNTFIYHPHEKRPIDTKYEDLVRRAFVYWKTGFGLSRKKFHVDEVYDFGMEVCYMLRAWPNVNKLTIRLPTNKL